MGKREDPNRKPKKRGGIGFTNMLAVMICIIMLTTILLGFVLSVMSIRAQYTSSLLAYTATIAPMDTSLGIVLNAVVKKSERENCSGNVGIKYAAAAANNFNLQDAFDDAVCSNSQPI